MDYRPSVKSFVLFFRLFNYANNILPRHLLRNDMLIKMVYVAK